MAMQATLHLNLSDALSAAELRQLLAAAEAQGKSIERVLFEAAREFAAQRKEEKEAEEQVDVATPTIS